MKYFMVLFLSALVINAAYAKKSKDTWDYPLNYYKNFEVTGSEDFLKFTFDLRKDADVIKEFNNNEETGVIGYLLYEDGNIVIDESDIPTHVQGDKIINGLLPSASMGKSLVSYVTGHAICEGYIESVNEKLTGWETVQNTLFQDQILIDLLNMQAGDDKYVGERRKPREDNKLKKYRSVNVNTIPLHDVMQKYFQNSKRDIPSFNAKKPKYNYSALTTNVIMNYVIYKTGDDWENLLRKIFNEHVKVKESVRFLQTLNVEDRGYSFESSRLRETGRYSFYANRYDYLRIAKAMLDDWHNDTCAGKYLKMLYEQRIKKNDNTKEFDDVGLYTASYGGQFHFDIFGLHKRRIIGLSGFAGQQILIDIDTKRIIVVNSLYKNYDWGKIVYNKIKN
tara:strand:+ start:193 stop:1371 length:1179 start_codon:yes stop_codon:yes gene_type:complete